MKKAMVFGTFDILLPADIVFFRQAEKGVGYLIVVVARNHFVKKAKGVLPKNTEKKRVSAVRKLNIVDKAILGSKKHDFYTTIRTYKPSVIALGYDQKPYVRDLKKDLRRHQLRNISVIRLRPYRPNVFKSSLLANQNE